MLGSNLLNSLCRFWNEKLISLQILYLYSLSWKIISLYFFSSNDRYFAQKEHIKMKILRLSSTEDKFCQIPYDNSERKSCFLSKFCIRLQFHERLFLCASLAQTIYTLLKRSTLKWKYLRLSNAAVKFFQIRNAIFESTRFLSKFCILLQFHERLFLCTFLAQTIYTLL